MSNWRPQEKENFGINWNPGPRHAYNTMPTPYQLLDWQKGLTILHCDDRWVFPTDVYTDYRQVYDLIEGRMVSLKFFYAETMYVGVATIYSKKFDFLPDPEKWLLLGNQGDTRYALGFYRIGCLHPRMQTYWKSMTGRHDECPDCDYHAVHDTLG